MPAPIVQSASAIGTTGSVGVTLGATPTPGNTLLAIMAADAYQTGAPTAGAGRSYTSRLSSQSNLGFYFWTRLVTSGDSATTTFTLGAASSACVVVEVAGTFDKTGTASVVNNSAGGSSACTGLTPATTDGTTLAVAGLTSTNTILSGISSNNGFTTVINAINSVSGGGRANVFVSSLATTTTTATGTTTISWSGLASDRASAQIAFTALAGGGSTFDAAMISAASTAVA
uniref:hypothetical protein n=1 Tax=Actinotalea sp. TaxID=1872145 RepID=UPI0035698A64